MVYLATFFRGLHHIKEILCKVRSKQLASGIKDSTCYAYQHHLNQQTAANDVSSHILCVGRHRDQSNRRFRVRIALGMRLLPKVQFRWKWCPSISGAQEHCPSFPAELLVSRLLSKWLPSL